MGLHPSTWFSLSPGGLDQTKPHHFREIARIAWEDRAEIPFAWRILGLLSESAVDPESGEPDYNARVCVERSG